MYTKFASARTPIDLPYEITCIPYASFPRLLPLTNLKSKPSSKMASQTKQKHRHNDTGKHWHAKSSSKL
jgi:hypothetical protein